MRKAVGIVLMAAVALVGTMVGPVTAGAGEAAGGAVTYVGTVKGLDASLAVAVEGGAAFAYLCDSAAISEWFKGPADNGVLTLTSPDGSQLIAEIDGKKLKGDVIVADAVEGFTLKEATGDAGLYRVEQTVYGTGYAAGWVVQPNGDIDGNVAVAALPGAAVVPAPLPLTRLPTTATTSPAIANGQLAPPAVVSQLPPAPPPDSQVDAVPSSFAANTTQGADDSGGAGNPSNNTPGNVGGATAPVEDPVPFGCEEASERLDTLNDALPLVQQAIEDAKKKFATRERLTALRVAEANMKREISQLEDFLEDECGG